MNTLRTCAAMLSIATLIVAAIFLLVPSVDFPAIVVLAIGAVALAIVAPFEAMDPPARRRVLIAAIIHVGTMVATLGFLALTGGGRSALLVTGGLAAAGLVIAGWAFRTRNRRRRAGWNHYYD